MTMPKYGQPAPGITPTEHMQACRVRRMYLDSVGGMYPERLRQDRAPTRCTDDERRARAQVGRLITRIGGPWSTDVFETWAERQARRRKAAAASIRPADKRRCVAAAPKIPTPRRRGVPKSLRNKGSEDTPNNPIGVN
jgi:hypothetical protein